MTKKMDDHVMEWEEGLPGPDELTPLSQMLITPELACAFSITPEPCRSVLDVSRASQNTMSSLRRLNSAPAGSIKGFPAFSAEENEGFELQGLDEGQNGVNNEEGSNPDGIPAGGESGDGVKKGRVREAEDAAEETSGFGYENSNEDQSARSLKRPRLVWTPQLHKRFVDVVAHLGIKNAVPKTIMQLMNVEGLTRENVASHLQKYRLYLKRMQGLSNEGPSPSDKLFASTPVPHNVVIGSAYHRDESMQMSMPMPMPMPFGSPVVPMPVVGIAHGHHHHHPHGHGPMAAGPMNPSAAGYGGYDPHGYGAAYARTFPQRVPSGEHDNGCDRVEFTSSYRHVVPRE